MNPVELARDVLLHEWRHNCRMIDHYLAQEDLRRFHAREDDFHGWLAGWCEALRLAALAEPAWEPLLAEARTLRDLWFYRSTAAVLEAFGAGKEETDARSVA